MLRTRFFTPLNLLEKHPKNGIYTPLQSCQFARACGLWTHFAKKCTYIKGGAIVTTDTPLFRGGGGMKQVSNRWWQPLGWLTSLAYLQNSYETLALTLRNQPIFRTPHRDFQDFYHFPTLLHFHILCHVIFYPPYTSIKYCSRLPEIDALQPLSSFPHSSFHRYCSEIYPCY